MREAINFIWKISIGAELAVAVRLLGSGLAGEYPALFVSCCVFPCKSLLLMWLYPHVTNQQARQISENLAPLEWICCTWIVFELFSRWTAAYPGIGRFGKILLAVLLVVAVGLSFVFWSKEWEGLDFVRSFRIYYIVHRMVYAVLGLFLLGTWLFFRNYPVAIAPNVVRHTRISLFYFLSSALAELAYTLNGPKYVAAVNLAIVSTTAISFGTWAALLTKAAQRVPEAQVVTAADRERIERLNMQFIDLLGGGDIPKHPN